MDSFPRADARGPTVGEGGRGITATCRLVRMPARMSCQQASHVPGEAGAAVATSTSGAMSRRTLTQKHRADQENDGPRTMFKNIQVQMAAVRCRKERAAPQCIHGCLSKWSMSRIHHLSYLLCGCCVLRS